MIILNFIKKKEVVKTKQKLKQSLTEWKQEQTTLKLIPIYVLFHDTSKQNAVEQNLFEALYVFGVYWGVLLCIHVLEIRWFWKERCLTILCESQV